MRRVWGISCSSRERLLRRRHYSPAGQRTTLCLTRVFVRGGGMLGIQERREEIEERPTVAQTTVPRRMTLECPRPESNQRTRFRKPLLYPLSYGGQKTYICGAFVPSNT